MKILLIGEYSRLHNSLKEGLIALGHEVTIIGFADGFKNYPVDFKFTRRLSSGIKSKIKVLIYRLTGFNIASYFTYRKFSRNKSRFAGYDVVQLISENSFYCEPWIEKKILRYIFDNNRKVYLLSCGDDYSSIRYYYEHPEEKSVVQPYFQGKIKKKNFLNALKFRKTSYRRLHEFILAHVRGIIASDLDYHLPLVGNSKYLGMIPNPVNVDEIEKLPMSVEEKIRIFLGINSESYFKKGIDHFEKALKIIQQKYSDKVEIIRTRNRPYAEYIHLYESSHILLDQAFARDQGYNALEAMAKGKVVFTGAEKIFTDWYKIEEPVAINTIPDAESIAADLSRLIENPSEIIRISNNARTFVEREHHYVKVAKRYVETWT